MWLECTHRHSFDRYLPTLVNVPNLITRSGDPTEKKLSRSLKVIECDTNRSDAFDVLLVIKWSISYRFSDIRNFGRKTQLFSYIPVTVPALRITVGILCNLSCAETR